MYKPCHIAQIKRKTLRLFAMIFFISCISFNSSYSSHAAGGDLIYQQLDTNTYLVTFKFYRDCSGIPHPNSVILCVVDSCNNNLYTTKNLFPINSLPDGRPNGSEVSVGCHNFKTRCETSSSSIPGYREWWYQDTIVLTNKCDRWILSVSINARNPSQNITGGNLLIEAMINNKDVAFNSSPVFHTKPVPYVCLNRSFVYNNGAVDPDNDSLAFEAIRPISSSGCAAIRYTVGFRTLNPQLRLPDNPFQTNNTYSLNPVTGNITYTASGQGSQTTTIIVREYRNGILVGSTMRDIQVQVTNCNIPPSVLDIDTTRLYGVRYNNGILEMCAGDSMSFCFEVTTSDSDAILVVTDNKDISIPTGNIAHQNNLTDTVNTCFNWQSSKADSGLKILTVNVKDSTCKPPGISVTQVFTIPIRLYPIPQPPDVTSPLRLCQHTPPQPLTANGQNLLWYTSSVGGTGSQNAPIPAVGVIGTRPYFVSHSPNGCESGRARIDVEVFPPPDIKLTVVPDSACIGEEFFAWDNANNSITPEGHIWNAGSGTISSNLPDSQIIVYWNTPGYKTIVLNINDSACSIFDSTEIYVVDHPHPHFKIDRDACLGKPTLLAPKVESGTYKWTVEEQTLTDDGFKTSKEFTWDSVGLKRISLTITNDFGCTNSLYDSTIIHYNPIAEITVPEQPICIGEVFNLLALDSANYTYQWTPEVLITHTDNEKAIAKAEKEYIYVQVTDQWNCITKDSVIVQPRNCCTVEIPGAFSPNGDGLNDMCKPVNQLGYQIKDFRIANRFGEIVYESIDRNSGWNGNYNGSPADVGAYYYFIKYECNDGYKGFKKGTIILLR